jgi:hypothetical protein
MLTEPESVIIAFQVTEKGERCIGNHGAHGLRYEKHIEQGNYIVFLIFERGLTGTGGLFLGRDLAEKPYLGGSFVCFCV